VARGNKDRVRVRQQEKRDAVERRITCAIPIAVYNRAMDEAERCGLTVEEWIGETVHVALVKCEHRKRDTVEDPNAMAEPDESEQGFEAEAIAIEEDTCPRCRAELPPDRRGKLICRECLRRSACRGARRRKETGPEHVGSPRTLISIATTKARTAARVRKAPPVRLGRGLARSSGES
jgi:hypothetical protein